ncbi:GRB2-binding adapter (GAPT) [Alteromonadaceae bacterium 2753L.S.0a.02]|nr:GRB2-binding adapter (GAPT) [Alteromonadaceae bacterium 2753L.S.0a.02]
MMVLVIAAALVILILSGVAIYYHWKLHKQRRYQTEQRQFLEKKQQQNRSSILIIARAMLSEQVTYTEASIRISVLLEASGIHEQEIIQYAVFNQLAQATAHIPILDAWKALSKMEKKKFEKERLRLEGKYRDFLIPAAEQLVQSLSERH